MRFWIVNLFFLLVCAFGYFRFREGLYCAYPISKKKKRVGFRNVWWFESHFQNGALHRAYYVNKIFFLAWCAVAAATLLFGWIPPMQPVITILIGMLGLAASPMSLWGMVTCNRKEYGTAIVILKPRKFVHGFYSSVTEILCSLVFPFFFVLSDLAIMGIV